MPRQRFLLSRLAGLWCALMAVVFAGAGPDMADAQSYQIRPGDTLRIEVLEDPSLNRTVLVAPDGRISVASAGTLRAAGLSVDSVQRALTNRLAPNFANPPNVFVAISGLGERVERPLAVEETITVYVLGETSKPGKMELEQGSTVLEAFAVMGGFTNFAATKRIQLRRVDPATHTERVFNLNYDKIERGAPSGRTPLFDGDIIVVPQRRLFE